MEYLHLRNNSDIRSIALTRLELPTLDQLHWLEKSFEFVSWGLPVVEEEMILIKSNVADFTPVLIELNSKVRELSSFDDALNFLYSKTIEYKSPTGNRRCGMFVTESSVLVLEEDFPYHNMMEFPVGKGWYSLWRSGETGVWSYCFLESWMMRQMFIHKNADLVPIIKSREPSAIKKQQCIGKSVDFDSVLQHFEEDVFGLGEYPFEFDTVFVELKYHHSDVTKPMKVEFKFGMESEVWRWDLDGKLGHILLLEYDEQRDCLTRFNYGMPRRIDIVNPERFWIYGAETQEDFDNEEYFWCKTLGDCLIYARLLVREQRLNMRKYCEGPKSEG